MCLARPCAQNLNLPFGIWRTHTHTQSYRCYILYYRHFYYWPGNGYCNGRLNTFSYHVVSIKILAPESSEENARSHSFIIIVVIIVYYYYYYRPTYWNWLKNEKNIIFLLALGNYHPLNVMVVKKK